jgi:hypothetical protein
LSLLLQFLYPLLLLFLLFLPSLSSITLTHSLFRLCYELICLSVCRSPSLCLPIKTISDSVADKEVF